MDLPEVKVTVMSRLIQSHDLSYPRWALAVRMWYDFTHFCTQSVLIDCGCCGLGVMWLAVATPGRSVWFGGGWNSLAWWRGLRWKGRQAALHPIRRLRGWTLGALGLNGNLKLISSISVSWPRLSETAPVDVYCPLTGPASSLMNSTIDL